MKEEYILARIIDDESDHEAVDIILDSWNEHLSVKTIWWKDMYDLDVASRVFHGKTKEQQEETVEPEKNPGLL